MLLIAVAVLSGSFLTSKSLTSCSLSLRAPSAATELSVDHPARLRGSETPRWTSTATLMASTAQKVID